MNEYEKIPGSSVITRWPEPVLTCKDVPYESNLTFNATKSLNNAVDVL